MSQEVQARLCVLWEHELRQAAAMLKRVQDEHDGMSAEDLNALIYDTLNACLAALHGAEDDTSPLMLSSASHLFKTKKRTK